MEDLPPLDVYYFSSVERYRRFFEDYAVTLNRLKVLKYHTNGRIREGTPHINLDGPLGRSCVLEYQRLKRRVSSPEHTTDEDVYRIIKDDYVIGVIKVQDGGISYDLPPLAELPFDKMHFRVVKLDTVTADEISVGGKTRHRIRKSRVSKGKKRQTRKNK